MKSFFKALEDLTWFMQLGISLLMPLALCMLLCFWLMQRFGVGPWVFIPGILLGIGSGAVSLHSFYRMIMRRQDNEIPKKSAVRFNRHL